MNAAARLTTGERWTREQLELLHAGHFHPGAIASFLVAARDRSAEARSSRPELARQARTWTAAGAVAWLALAAADRGPFRRRLASGLSWWAGVGLMLDWHLGMVETESGTPRPLGAADALTLTRAWLVPAVADGGRPSLLLAAGATDVLDGALARAGEPTRAGRDLEGMADAALFAAALLAAARRDQLPRAVIGLELGRLGAGVAYASGTYFARAEAPNRTLTGAARLLAPVRLLGLAASAGGGRRLGASLLAAGSVASLAALADALRSDQAAR